MRCPAPLRPRPTAVAAVAIAGLALPAGAAAAGPANDAYLASTILRTATGGFPAELHTTVDTTEATTQPDLFQPSRDGQALGGGPAEPLTCDGQSFGKTVWFDFRPPIAGAVELTAGGFDTALAVYEYDPSTSLPTRPVACAATPGAGESLTLPGPVKAGASYTVQVGGQLGADGQAAGGALAFGFSFFGDRDGDGTLDALPDRCPDLPGIGEAGGCPPTLRPTVTYSYRSAGSGVRLDRVTVRKAPARARITARWGGHRLRVTVARDGERVSLAGLRGAALAAGSSLHLQITRPAGGTGRYRFGAIGADFRYAVTGSRIGERTDRCLLPGQSTPRKSCRRPAR